MIDNISSNLSVLSLMQKLVLASGNTGKLMEMHALLQPIGLQLIPQNEFIDHAVEETGLTFVENAIIKARYASLASGLPALADDSGLEVDALQGAPGIYSARYAGVTGLDRDRANNIRLLTDLADMSEVERKARLHCVLAYMRHPQDPVPIICQASWEGLIMDQPKGYYGFGYDPHFQVLELDCRAAELMPAEKQQLSHRGQALRQLISILKTEMELGQ